MKRAILGTVLGHFAALGAILAILQGNPAQGDTHTVWQPAPVPALVSSFPRASGRQTLRPVPPPAAPVLLSHRPSDTPRLQEQGQAAGRRKIPRTGTRCDPTGSSTQLDSSNRGVAVGVGRVARAALLDEPMSNQAARSACTPPSDGRERSDEPRPHV